MKENIDWAKIRARLPFEKTKQQYAERSRLWKYIDVNNNGYLSLAEIDKGLRDILRLDEIFNAKPVIMRAFQAAKNAVKNKKKYGPDYVDRSEFRLLLMYLRQYYEYYQAFQRIDTSGDRRIDIQEFILAVPSMEKWVGPISNPYKTFQQIDTNNGGKILFDEFCRWAIRMDLDLDDDDDQLNFFYSNQFQIIHTLQMYINKKLRAYSQDQQNFHDIKQQAIVNKNQKQKQTSQKKLNFSLNGQVPMDKQLQNYDKFFKMKQEFPKRNLKLMLRNSQKVHNNGTQRFSGNRNSVISSFNKNKGFHNNKDKFFKKDKKISTKLYEKQQVKLPSNMLKNRSSSRINSLTKMKNSIKEKSFGELSIFSTKNSQKLINDNKLQILPDNLLQTSIYNQGKKQIEEACTNVLKVKFETNEDTKKSSEQQNHTEKEQEAKEENQIFILYKKLNEIDNLILQLKYQNEFENEDFKNLIKEKLNSMIQKINQIIIYKFSQQCSSKYKC